MSASCLSNHLRRGVHDLPARARIENALGVAIWADPDQFTRRAACAKVLGTDPETLREIELRALAAKLPLRPGGSRRAKLIERILDFATANPGFKL